VDIRPREVIAGVRHQKITLPETIGSVMLAYGYRVASNVVYGNTSYRKVHSGGGFFLVFVTCRNDALVPLFAGCVCQTVPKASQFNGFRGVVDPIFN